MFKRIIGTVLLAGFACMAFATDARIETMGGHDHFFADEMSIHRNPANMGLYGSIMYGSYGFMEPFVVWEQRFFSPQAPYFGGAISFGQKEGSLSKISVGATFNRVDSALNYVAYNLDELGLRVQRINNNNVALRFAGDSITLHPATAVGPYTGTSGNNPEFLGKVDLMAAYTLANGTTIGLSGYLAFQDGSRADLIPGIDRRGEKDELTNRFVKGTIGVNTPIGDGVDLEASVGISTLTLRGMVANPASSRNTGEFAYAADSDLGIQIDVRMFADIAAINGAFVPHLQANIFNYENFLGEQNIIDFNAGLGLNVNIDRGFFWTGLEGVYNKKSSVLFSHGGNLGGTSIEIIDLKHGKKDIIGGRIGFGIERNVLTDWLILRVGGSKLLAKESRGSHGYRWLDSSDEDLVSLGMGVNIEDRLKIDTPVSANLPYTFTNLFSGNSPYLMSRVSAVFSF